MPTSNTKGKIQWQKDYDFDSLADYQRDLLESFDQRFNPNAVDVPQDKNGVFKGFYRITVEYFED